MGVICHRVARSNGPVHTQLVQLVYNTLTQLFLIQLRVSEQKGLHSSLRHRCNTKRSVGTQPLCQMGCTSVVQLECIQGPSYCVTERKEMNKLEQ